MGVCTRRILLTLAAKILRCHSMKVLPQSQRHESDGGDALETCCRIGVVTASDFGCRLQQRRASEGGLEGSACGTGVDWSGERTERNRDLKNVETRGAKTYHYRLHHESLPKRSLASNQQILPHHHINHLETLLDP